MIWLPLLGPIEENLFIAYLNKKKFSTFESLFSVYLCGEFDCESSAHIGSFPSNLLSKILGVGIELKHS